MSLTLECREDPSVTTFCRLCARLATQGRGNVDRIHCRKCHGTWTGVEAQHCVRCHHTFANITAADSHRYYREDKTYVDRCVDPAITPGWRERRPGVWTDAAVRLP